MENFRITEFDYSVICEGGSADAKVSFEAGENSLEVYLTASDSKPEFVNMKWSFETDGDPYVLGDAFERSYGELGLKKLSQNNRPMPWYFAVTDKENTACFGVMTQPDAFVCFTYDKSGISAKIDCRNGGSGVELCGRKIKLCTFVLRRYSLPPVEALRDYCKVLCPSPLLPKEKIYGGNNWYYAYGDSSRKAILGDTALQAELAAGIENRPFMVIDDGWEVNSCQGPFLPNEKYGDMKTLADEMKAMGVRPGIWVRLLDNPSPEITDEMRILRDGERQYLDPTVKEVQDFIRADIERIRSWGYEMLKHDFSTVDLFGNYGMDLTDEITNSKGWHFADRTKTNAEIVLDLYRLILDTCGDMLIIGCNTVSHLCAGLVHINRTGDDTSGREWARTRKMGINSLAFRLAQNGAFYVVDADCVGILGDNIPWEKNRQWLEMLAVSDTALFTSCGSLNEEQKADIAKAYKEIQKDHICKPVDIYDNLTPREWAVDGKTMTFDIG